MNRGSTRPLSAGEPVSRPPRIFLSYRRDDAAPYAGRLYDALAERFGDANVFMDVDTIALGTDFTTAIDRALASCDAVVALIGRSWLDASGADGRRRLDDPGDVLRLELERALAGPLVVVPTCVQGASLPAEEELPPTLAPLARRQGIELRDTAWRDDVARLVRQLEQAVRPPAQPAPEDSLARTPRWQHRRLAAAAVTLLVAAVAIAGVVIAKGGRDGGERMSPAEQRLLRAVPQVIRPHCTSIDWGPESALARVSCSGARVNANYYLFASAAVLDGWYVLAREDAGVGTDSGTCTADDWFGEGAYLIGEAVAGRRFCYFEGGEATLVWTDAQARVGGKANVWSGTGEAAAATLLAQWRCCFQPQP